MRHVFRLHPGDDLRGGIEAYAAEHSIRAAALTACAGCVRRWRLRGADGKTVFEGAERAEIVSLTGTVSVCGCHLHVALAREDLSVFGGHLLPGCTVNTTAEIVLEEIEGRAFRRMPDPQTGYKELVIESDVISPETAKS